MRRPASSAPTNAIFGVGGFGGGGYLRSGGCAKIAVSGDTSPAEANLTDRQAFADLLDRFAAACVANDGARFAGLFTEDGTYEDDFFGLYRGRAAITAMLQRFHDTGASYRWDFYDLVSDGVLGYASFRFSFTSKLRGHEGRPVLISGISCFRFEGASIAAYRESFDTGIALAQLGFPAERLARVLAKEAAAQNDAPEAREHLHRFGNQTPA